MGTWSPDQWGFSSGCVRNDANCSNFISGSCKSCKWGHGKNVDGTFGDWCYVTWYAWLLFYFFLFFGIGLLICTILACKTCCAQNRKYKKMTNVEAEDCHVELAEHHSEEEQSYSDDHVRYSDPYH